MTLPPAVPAPDRHYPPVARRSRRWLWLVLAIVPVVIVVIALVVYLAGRTDRERHANIDAMGAAAEHCGVATPDREVGNVGDVEVDRENGRIEFPRLGAEGAPSATPDLVPVQSWADVECVGDELGMPDEALAAMQEPGSESYSFDEGYRWGPYWVTWSRSAGSDWSRTAEENHTKRVTIYHDWSATVYDD